MTDGQRVRGEVFRALHGGGTFVLPNAWDAASASMMAPWAPALATTSSGISWSMGWPDGGGLSRAEMLAVVARIAAVTELPVSADVESGYGPQLEDMTETATGVLAAGAVGLNLEDSPGPGDEALWALPEQCARIAAVREAVDGRDVPFTVNARTDVFLRAVGPPEDRLELTLARAEGFRDAGADCLFVPGLGELPVIVELVRRSPLPVNILASPGAGPSIAELAGAGVRRVSVGGAIARAAYTLAGRAAADLARGAYDALDGACPHPEIQARFPR